MNQPEKKSGSIPAMVVVGLGVSVLLWVLWFLSHVPWIGLPERFSLPLLLVAWLGGMVFACRGLGRSQAWRVGLGGGIVSATVGLLVVGSKLRPPPAVEGEILSVVPAAPWIVLGFLATGAVVGFIGGVIGGLIPSRSGGQSVRDGGEDWAPRFAWVAAAAALPLVFLGGLVTSTNSGMAVPDWPNTFGTNMFLYPLGPRSEPGVFLEHSHRLFGTLLGLTSVVLGVWYSWGALPGASRLGVPALLIIGGVATAWLIREGQVNAGFGAGLGSIAALAAVLLWRGERPARWFALFALLMLGFVVVQGWLGGRRVIEDSRALALAHGISAQLLFAALVGLATAMSAAYAGLAGISPQTREVRRLKLFATGTLHALILQLLLGAAYRHMEHKHILWTHAGFAVIVLVFALLAGMVGAGFMKDHDGACRTVRRTGYAMAILVGVQFIIGWVAFMGTGQARGEASIPMVLVRTVHQTNGALLLGTAAALWLLARRATLARRHEE